MNGVGRDLCLLVCNGNRCSEPMQGELQESSGTTEINWRSRERAHMDAARLRALLASSVVRMSRPKFGFLSLVTPRSSDCSFSKLGSTAATSTSVLPGSHLSGD